MVLLELMLFNEKPQLETQATMIRMAQKQEFD